jgi:transcriptional regulator with XRE-family HTH domain
MDIGKNIKTIRKKLNITQKQLASRLGVSQQMIATWENSERELTITTVVKIANALEVDIGELFQESNNTNPSYVLSKLPPNELYELACQAPDVFGASINDGTCEVFYTDDNDDKQTLKRIVVSNNPLDNPDVKDLFKTLNKDGQQKLIEHAKLLAKIPEYQAEPVKGGSSDSDNKDNK